MKRDDTRSFRALGALVSSGLVLTLAACPPPVVPNNQGDGGKSPIADEDGGGGVDPEDDGGDGNPGPSDAGVDAGPSDAGLDGGPDGGPGDDTPFTAVIAPVDDAPLGTDFRLDSTSSINPDDQVLTTIWQVRTPEGEGCAGALLNATSAVATFTPACRGEHTAVLTLSSLDGTSSTDEETFLVLNNPPVLSDLALQAEFDVGGLATLTATVTDADDDATTCTARLAATNTGDPAGLVIPTEPSADCSFEIQTPARLEVWTIEVVASDGEDESTPATIQIAPRNNPPVLATMDLDAATVGYACDDTGCASEPIRVTMTASDDVDDFEDLLLDIEDVSADAPEGTVLEVTEVEGEHGVFDIVIRRDTPGPLAGDYRILGRVTEYTAATAASATLERTFQVTGQAPTISNVVANSVAHTYDAASQRFLATVEVTFDAHDPEGNALTSSAALVRCPDGDYGSANCGGANLSIEETVAEGSLTLELSSSDLATLVGAYRFSITVSDPDGQSAPEQQPELAVTNAAPTRTPGAPESVEQRFAGGLHEATFPFVGDPEGDPLVVTLTVVCPDASQTQLGGTCAGGQRVSLSEDGVITVRGAAHPSFLGNYGLVGSVSDSHATTNLNVTLEVTNTAPSVTVTSGATQTCHHKTTNNTVTNAADCALAFSATALDANGDPLVVITEDVSDSFAFVFGTTSQSGNSLSQPLSVSASLDDFVAAFNAAQGYASTSARFRVTDPFGAGPAASTVNVRLQNRAPTVSVTSSATQSCHHKTTGTTVTNDDDCEYAFVATATDPDGDPLSLAVTGQSNAALPTFDETTVNGSTISKRGDASMSLSQFQSIFDGTRGYASSTATFRVTDALGHGPAGTEVEFRLTNRAPVVTGTPGLTPSECHHKTTGNSVTNEPGCEYTFSANVSDPDGDPLSLTGLDVDDAFEVAFGPATSSGNTLAMSFSLTTSYANFVDAFDSTAGKASTLVQFQLADALGAGPAVFPTHPGLLNRPPSFTGASFRGEDGTSDPDNLNNNQLTRSGSTRTGARYEPCTTHPFTGIRHCPRPSDYKFSIVLDATDPDGDPLDVTPSLTCTNNTVTDDSGASPNTTRELPANRRIPLRLPGTLHGCYTSPPVFVELGNYRRWNLQATCRHEYMGNCLQYNNDDAVPCSLSANTEASDGLESASLGARVSTRIEATESSTSVGCP